MSAWAATCPTALADAPGPRSDALKPATSPGRPATDSLRLTAKLHALGPDGAHRWSHAVGDDLRGDGLIVFQIVFGDASVACACQHDTVGLLCVYIDGPCKLKSVYITLIIIHNSTELNPIQATV